MADVIQNMKKHTCPTCGGQLRINMERQMYECPFCGVTFDYEYFREDDVLERAAKALNVGEFRSAEDAYDFMLAKEPANFFALRGKILVASRVRSITEFNKPHIVKGLFYGKIDPHVDHAIEYAKVEHKPYFSKMKELFDAGKAYNAEIRNLDRSKKRRGSKARDIRFLSKAEEEPMVQLGESWEGGTVNVHPMSVIVGIIAVFIIWTFFVILFGSFMMKNPYTHEKANQTTEASRYHSSYSGYVNRYVIINSSVVEVPSVEQNDWSNIVTSISDDQSDWQEENKKKDQEARQKKADEWEERHKDDWIILVFLIVIPAIAGVIGIVFMRKRLDHLNEIEKKIVEAEADAQKIDDETMAHRSKVEEIRKKMVLLYRELVALDPYPESKV